MSRIATVAADVAYDDQFWQTGYTADIVDEAGRATRIETDVFGCYTLKPVPNCSLNESGGRSIIDGKEGVGWMECCWPTDYLEHIRAHGPYLAPDDAERYGSRPSAYYRPSLRKPNPAALSLVPHRRDRRKPLYLSCHRPTRGA